MSGGMTPDTTSDSEATVNAMSSNQTQEYFAIATDKGFEIV
jgi:hypothetical protein